MKNNRSKSLIFLLAILLVMWSCEDYINQFKLPGISTDFEIEPSVAAPVMFGSFSLQDILESIDSGGFVSQTTDSLLYIYYIDTAYSVAASELIVLPDKLTSEVYIESDVNTLEWLALPVGQSLQFTKTEMLDFEIEPDDQIDSVYLKAGNLIIEVFSEFEQFGTLTISSPFIFEPNGDTLIRTFPISIDNGTFTDSKSYTLEGYKFEIQEEAGNAVIPINFVLELTKSVNPILVDQECGIEMNFDAMEFSHIYGFVANREVINTRESLEIEFYDAVSSLLDVYFKEPEFNVYVQNSYGIPLVLSLNDVSARSSQDGNDYPLLFEPGVMPFDVEAPGIDQMGEMVLTSIGVNAETSNIDEVIAEAPDMFSYTVVANTGTIPGLGEQNFLLDTSSMIVQAELVLPMYLKTGGYTIEDTLELDLEGMFGNFGFIQNANVRLTTSNEWPMQIDLQLYFLDEGYEIVDSLFKENRPLISPAPVDNNGELIKAELVDYEINIDYTGEEFSNLDGTKYAWLKARAVTSENGASYVKFYSHYLLHYKLTIDADFKINPSELNFDSE